ncbi:hypothetical protein C5167_001886 [Papaver somniferum]|uniref:dihydropyrimidinase n=1 Tax=Papaver somniferum TaxID=3469 RepID=A0A4Y7L001_PAPSO|nr:hypothetical protein C5167_001886 [Papaver somniferum]
MKSREENKDIYAQYKGSLICLPIVTFCSTRGCHPRAGPRTGSKRFKVIGDDLMPILEFYCCSVWCGVVLGDPLDSREFKTSRRLARHPLPPHTMNISGQNPKEDSTKKDSSDESGLKIFSTDVTQPAAESIRLMTLIHFTFPLFFLLLQISTIKSHSIPGFCGVGYGDSECGIGSSSSKLLIKGGTVVNAHHQEIADVYVEDGIIVSLQPNIMVGDDVTVLDATGKYVMPGGIDPHTHLAMEFMGTETIDDFFSGQAAALAGGTTMHIDFVIPVNGSLTAGFESYTQKAKKSCMDYGFHMAVTKWDEVVARDMEIMVKDKGINSFKFFLAYKGSLMINDELLLEAFKKCKSLGALTMVHAENGDAVAEGQKRMIELGITGPEGHPLSRPPVLEGEATARAIRLAGFINTPLYIVHVMSIDAMEEIAKAQKLGQKVIGEPVTSGLVLDDSKLWDPDFTTAAKYVMSPPIRKLGHGKALQAALSTGVLQLVGTDHCTFNSTQKAFGIDDFRKIPNGVNGVRSDICYRLCADNKYRMGAILAGSDADIIILNPNSSVQISAKSHHSRTDTNVYEGLKLKGKVEVTIAGGRVVWENDELKVIPGSGRYIKMSPFNYLFNGISKADAAYLSSLKAPVRRFRDQS